jgi:hypothetical protein
VESLILFWKLLGTLLLDNENYLELFRRVEGSLQWVYLADEDSSSCHVQLPEEELLSRPRDFTVHMTPKADEKHNHLTIDRARCKKTYKLGKKDSSVTILCNKESFIPVTFKIPK